MSEWTYTPDYRTKTVQFGNCTIIIERPVLTPAEQAKREAQAKSTLERVLRDYITRKEGALH